VVLDPKVTEANLATIRSLGATVNLVDEADGNGGYLLARLARVREIRAQDRDCYWTNQYGSSTNPDAHYYGTGLEIVLAAPHADAIMVPCSTGGTVAGIAARVRAAGLNTEVVPVDIPGSHAVQHGVGRRYLSGIGSARASAFVHADERARTMIVEDAMAIATCRAFERDAGISVGGSSGAAILAALRWLQGRRSGRHVVVVCPDGGASYDFSDAGLARIGIDQIPSLAAFLDDFSLGAPPERARTRVGSGPKSLERRR
jgi:N-(2-amino-2-carboxyethyl)-L-glutamate synthase